MSKPREFAGDPAAAAIVTWYLVRNSGDHMTFVPDEDTIWPIERFSDETSNWPDVMNRVIEQLIQEKVLADNGRSYEDEDEPETVYVRELRNCWLEQESG